MAGKKAGCGLTPDAKGQSGGELGVYWLLA
jgi:hypothetical protein